VASERGNEGAANRSRLSTSLLAVGFQMPLHQAEALTIGACTHKVSVAGSE